MPHLVSSVYSTQPIAEVFPLYSLYGGLPQLKGSL